MTQLRRGQIEVRAISNKARHQLPMFDRAAQLLQKSLPVTRSRGQPEKELELPDFNTSSPASSRELLRLKDELLASASCCAATRRVRCEAKTGHRLACKTCGPAFNLKPEPGWF